MFNIVKHFPGVTANDHINFDVKVGEIHGLLGENGAGKTTLMNILYGLLQPDEGEIYVGDREVNLSTPRDAILCGIGMVHQHFTLIPRLTVAENITLGFKTFSGSKGSSILENKVKEIAKIYGLKVDLDQKVENLSVGEKQRVEIVKLLCRGATILILDEPTSVLTPQETEGLFGALKVLAEKGHSIIFITHKVREALLTCSRITVLRKGRVVSVVTSEEVDARKLAEMMVGTSVGAPSIGVKLELQRTAPAVELKDIIALSDDGRVSLKELSLQIYGGEILGIAGVSGNGQRELAEVIAGLRKPIKGEMLIFGKPVKRWSRSYLLSLGISYIPEDRLEALLPGLSLWRTAILGSHFSLKFNNKGILNIKKINEEVEKLIKDFRIVAPSPDVNAENLSGGNIQRLMVAREISRPHRILVASQPTRGLDIAMTEYIHNLLLKTRDNGTACLLISEDLDEILGLSDRIAVIYDGNIRKIFGRGEADLYEIGRIMMGA